MAIPGALRWGLMLRLVLICGLGTAPPANIFHVLLDPTPITESLRVEPCDGAAPMLCVDVDTGEHMVVELLVSPLSRLTELRPRADEASDEAVLERFASEHLEAVERDRRGAHGGAMRFVADLGEPVRVGALRGWRFGFVLRDRHARPIERQLTYAAYDDDVFYVLAVHFDDDPLSDTVVERMLPELDHVVAGLSLPVPVSETDVRSVEVIEDSVVASLVYGEGVLGPVPASAELTVTGRSPDGAFWRVRCLDERVRECWVPSDATRSLSRL